MSDIKVLKLINDHLQRFDTSDALIGGLDVLAEYWLRSDSSDHKRIIEY
jgi:hypothetical protein